MSTDSLVVRKSVTVPLSADRAFELFTSRMTEFWPKSHSIGAVPLAEAVVEPHAGGRWYERGADGSECSWGRVTVWEPPTRLVLLWQIDASFKFDPDLETEVEITFTEEGGATRVDLVHRDLERFGDQAFAVRDTFDSPGGWPGILDAYVAAA
ncbi:SRPBCC family protein [Cryptosporangium sp. NPDC048952]|uniref:SRPBCC family protein n=1 Tax=Cryptosporangium sp. NPDC048952 TaxID=3363961 RepID=UPI003717DF59